MDVVSITIDLRLTFKTQSLLHFTISGFISFFTSIFSAAVQCVPIFSRFFCQKSREISVPATSHETLLFEISLCVQEKMFLECMLRIILNNNGKLIQYD